MEKTYDFSGWATRNNLKCSDGRTIMKDAFRDNNGQTVPLVWNHQHSDPNNVLGHALLENRNDGVYAYCTFNSSESAKTAKLLVQHGDVDALSIYANQLKQNSVRDVLHGNIREVSLVLAGANPGAFIDSVILHGEEFDEDGVIYTGEPLSLYHSEEEPAEETADEKNAELSHADESSKENKNMPEDSKKTEKAESEETIQDIFDTMTEKQQNAVYVIVERAVEDAKAGKFDDDDDKNEKSKGGNETMKHNVFDQDAQEQANVLTHADQEAILELAKSRNVGSFQSALRMYAEEHLQHGFEDVTELFPDYEWVKPGAPEMITRDQTWIDGVLSKVHKSPYSRIRMRQADLRVDDIRALGYEKATEKKLIGSIKLVNRTFDPQTVYVKDKIDRDDVVDITDFDVVDYQRKVMRMALNEELALAIMIGDGREEGAEGKIYESHIRSIWNDDDLYTIHTDVDLDAAKAELQGTNTSANFGENYIYAEAIITAALYAREKYKGSGSLDFYCTPHLLNVMLLARDLNGRRIYDSKSDLAAALNVGNIYTVEQFENKTRTTDEGGTKKLLGLFVNLSDYQVGSTKGGEITNFDDFDIDFNQYKYLMETRLSGALTRVFSAIALEEPVAETAAG